MDFEFSLRQNSLINWRFSLCCETPFSAMKKLESFFIAENIWRFKK